MIIPISGASISKHPGIGPATLACVAEGDKPLDRCWKAACFNAVFMPNPAGTRIKFFLLTFPCKTRRHHTTPVSRLSSIPFSGPRYPCPD